MRDFKQILDNTKRGISAIISIDYGIQVSKVEYAIDRLRSVDLALIAVDYAASKRCSISWAVDRTLKTSRELMK